jgi:hypothetical protein
MKKFLLILGILVLIFAGVIIFGLSKVGPLIKTAVNTYGPEMTKTAVHLGNVDVSLFSAKAQIKDFYLGNPKGFKSPEAMKVGSILVDIDEKTLTKQTHVIDRIEVLNPQLTYERTATTDNFQAILNNVRKAGSHSRTSGISDKESKSAKIIIKDFKLTGGKVTLAAELLGQNKSFSTDLPNIHLTNIGEAKGGVSAEQAFQIILAELQKGINSPNVMNSINQELKNLKETSEKLKQQVSEQLKDTEKNLKQEVEKNLNKKADDALKNLLGK